MANDDSANDQADATDIVFRCGACGKSLVINALGAGLTITCPDCGRALADIGNCCAQTECRLFARLST